MKKIIIVTLLNIIFICLFALSGCSFDNTYYEISTVEELYAMESDKNYQLTCDIDLKEREWYPLGVRGFNGNGFTISNCYIGEIYKIQHGIAVNDYSVYMGFFGRVDKLENVVFDNININYSVVNDELGNFGIAGGVVGCASNVCIKNSSAFFKITYDYALLINCYLAEVGQTSPNINKLSVLTEEEWLRVLEILSLDDEIWTLENGLLDLKIVG